MATLKTTIRFQKTLRTIVRGVGRPGPAGIGGGLEPIAANSLLGNPTGATANPVAMTPAEVSTLLNLSGTYLALSGGTLTGTLDGTVFRTHNLYTNEANRETGLLQWSANVFRIGTEKAGTGVARPSDIVTDGITRLRVDTDYQVRVGDQGANAPSFFTFAVGATTSNGQGRGLSIFGRNNVINGIHIGLVGDTFVSTSGANSLVLVGCTFSPTSGTATFTAERIAPTVNQTGGANGITRGVSIEPTLTAAADWRSYDTNVNTGFAYHSSGTAPSRFGGAIIVSGNIQFGTGNPLLRFANSQIEVRNSADTAYDNFRALQVNANIRTDSITRNSTNTSITIGNSGLSNPGTATLIPGGLATHTNSTGLATWLTIDSRINQTGTAGTTDFIINRTETVLGSGAQNFCDFQIAGVSQFRVSRTGAITALGNLTAPIGTTADLMVGTGTSGILETKTPAQARAAIGVNTTPITLAVNGYGAIIPVGKVTGHFFVPFDCVITGWEIVANEPGSMVVDLWKDTYANAPPTNGDSITGSAKPTLTASQKANSTTLTDWTTALNAGDYLEVEIESNSAITWFTLVLRVTRT